MTRSEIRTLILGWLDDANSGYFSSTLVNTWINLAHREVQMKLLQSGENYYQVPVETLTVSGQADYVLPSDFMVEHRIELVRSGSGVNEDITPIAPITTNQKDFVAHSLGVPQVYAIKKDRFTLYPTPDAVYTLRLYYSPMVSDLGSDSDVPDVPEQYMEYVALVAAFNGFIKDDRPPQNLALKKDKFERLLDQMAEDRTQDGSRSVVMTSDYDTGMCW
jgi:hypothetical protein